MARSKKPLSEADREERRTAQRKELEQALGALLTSDGWRRWLRTRATLHGYSAKNTLLIAHQAWARGMSPTHVAGFREIDTDLMRAHYDGHPIHLSRLEFALLAQLGEAPRRVWAKPELLKAIWGFENPTEAKTRTVDAHACRLRRKLHDAGAEHLVVNRRGVGYALTTDNNNNNNGDGDGGEAA